MIQVKVGSIEWQSCPNRVPLPGYVLFSGEFLYEADNLTEAMIWDAALNNVRPMTQAEKDARAAQRIIDEAAAKPNRTTLRQQAAAALADNTTYLALSNPTNAQSQAQVRRLTQECTALIKRLAEID